jgi:hypothetical protein
MSYDLIFGRTHRDWSCGSLINKFPGQTPDIQQQSLDTAIEVSNQSVEKLFADTRKEIQNNYDAVQRLTRAKRLPAVEHKSFASFLEKWLDYGLSKNGIFGPDDIEQLTAYREANKRFTERPAIFINVAATPLKKPVVLPPALTAATTTSLVPSTVPPTASGGSGFGSWLLGIGLGLFGLGFIVRKK